MWLKVECTKDYVENGKVVYSIGDIFYCRWNEELERWTTLTSQGKFAIIFDTKRELTDSFWLEYFNMSW